MGELNAVILKKYNLTRSPTYEGGGGKEVERVMKCGFGKFLSS